LKHEYAKSDARTIPAGELPCPAGKAAFMAAASKHAHPDSQLRTSRPVD